MAGEVEQRDGRNRRESAGEFYGEKKRKMDTHIHDRI